MPPDFETSMMATIAELATNFVEEMKNKLDEVNAPSNERTPIKDSIYIDPPKAGKNNTITIDIRIPLSEAPAAAAYEWGSGEHARFGDAQEYPIYAHNQEWMIWPKADWPQYQPPPNAPLYFKFKEVQHPGVEPRPYIAPSIEKMRKIFAEKLTRELVTHIMITGHTYSGRYYELARVVIT